MIICNRYKSGDLCLVFLRCGILYVTEQSETGFGGNKLSSLEIGSVMGGSTHHTTIFELKTAFKER